MTAIVGMLGKMVVGIVGEKIKDKIMGTGSKHIEPDGKGLIQSKTAWGGTGALVLLLAQTGWPETPAD